MATNKDIVETALSYVGKLKYVFGSDNISGGTGDCSSYTEYVFKKNGVEIGANTESQYSKGIRIEKGNELPGDLIFFKNTYKSGHTDGVSHVGIVTEKGKFVDLGNSGCSVKSMDSSYYKEHFLAIKRMNIAYTDEDIDTSSGIHAGGSFESSSSSNKLGLKWWGDVVKVVVVILLLIGGVALLATSFGVQIIKKGVF